MTIENGELLDERRWLGFEELGVGDVLRVVTGKGEDAWTYTFAIKDTSSQWPKTEMTARTPDGEERRINLSIHGCGHWTSREQNPVQKRARAFTPCFDGLWVGSFMLGLPEGASERIVFDKPGQEIAKIEVERAKRV